MSGSDAGPGARAQGWGAGVADGAAAARRRLPAYADLQRAARHRIAGFAYDFVAGGVGDGAPNVAHNRAAMDAVRIVPRYGVDVARVSTDTRIFGDAYAMPLGVAPMGNVGLVWPGADVVLARAAQEAGIPWVSSTVANIAIEDAARIAPDVFWFQLYGVPGDDHAVSIDLIRRADAAGARALVLTLDVPTRQKRVHDVRNGLSVPFRWRAGTVRDVAMAPLWSLAMLRQGQPRFENLRRYVGADATLGALADFAYTRMTSGITWEWIARFRDVWPRALVVKGLQHPADAARAVALGVDGVWVSNHGGRQFDAAPASIDCVPAIAAELGGRAKLLYDGSIRSGLDVLRALASGADFTFAGRGFLWAVAALGAAGGTHAASAYAEELRGVMGQAGLRDVAEAMAAPVLHPAALPGAVARPSPNDAAGLEPPRRRRAE